MNERQVRRLLTKYRTICCRYGMLKATSKNTAAVYVALKQKQMLESWLNILDDLERPIVERHLVAGLTWPMVIQEFQDQWGEMETRHERSLKRTQANAIKKILNNIAALGMEEEVLELFHDFV